jgi:hypothetical protein
MDTAASDLYEGLMSELECPVCYEYMVPPICLCKSGHSICKNCRPKMAHCPTCRQEFTNIRCQSLEKLSSIQRVTPCPYQKYGCKEMISADDKTDHRKVCPYGAHSCPFRCPMKLTRKYLTSHIKQDHKGMFRKCNERTEIIKIENYNVTKVYSEVIIAHEDVFLSTIRVVNATWYFLLQYVGPEQDLGTYSYKFCLDKTGYDAAFVKIRHWCRSIYQDVSEIYRRCKCIMLPADVICHSLNGGDLCFYLKIEKCN